MFLINPLKLHTCDIFTYLYPFFEKTGKQIFFLTQICFQKKFSEYGNMDITVLLAKKYRAIVAVVHNVSDPGAHSIAKPGVVVFV